MTKTFFLNVKTEKICNSFWKMWAPMMIFLQISFMIYFSFSFIPNIQKISFYRIKTLLLSTHFLMPHHNLCQPGSLYHHGHLSRAVCCRLSHSTETQELTATLPTLYHINHPQLGCVTAFDPPRGTEKTKALSINWFIDCPGPEVTDGTKGR